MGQTVLMDFEVLQQITCWEVLTLVVVEDQLVEAGDWLIVPDQCH